MNNTPYSKSIVPTQIHVLQLRTIAIVVFDGAEIINITGPIEVFTFANIGLKNSGVCQEAAYKIEVLAAQAGPITTSCGLQIIANKAYREVTDGIDTLLIAGAPDVECLLGDPALQAWVKFMAPRVRRLASVCTGAFLLAETGQLNGLRATSHWAYCEQLANRYPKVKIEPDHIFVREGHISTSGGITSGIDLTLALVEEDWGSEVALGIAQYLVIFLKRPGGQSQFSAYLTNPAEHPKLKDLQAWIMLNLTEDLRVETLASRMCMSPRNFARFFMAETGATPAKFVELARIDAARHFLGSTQLSIENIATKAGFGDPERMRRTFIRHLGISPHDYRKRFGGTAELHCLMA